MESVHDDADIAALVVALMSPFEDRIAALEQQITDLRSQVTECVTYDDFLQLQGDVESIVTRQKASAVMTSHTMHQVRALSSQQEAFAQRAEQAVARQPTTKQAVPKQAIRPPDSSDAAAEVAPKSPTGNAGVKKKSQAKGDTGKGIVFRQREQTPSKAQAAGSGPMEEPCESQQGAFKFNFDDSEAEAGTASKTAAQEEPASAPEEAPKDRKGEAKPEGPQMTAKQLLREQKKKEKEAARAAAEAEEAEAVAAAKARLISELAWCIAQLDAGLLQPGANPEPEQVKESEKVKKLLLSSKVPLVRKRHTMKLVFGDYRNLMKELEVPDEYLQAAHEALKASGCCTDST